MPDAQLYVDARLPLPKSPIYLTNTILHLHIAQFPNLWYHVAAPAGVYSRALAGSGPNIKKVHVAFICNYIRYLILSRFLFSFGLP